MSNTEIASHGQAIRLFANGYFPLPCQGKAPIGIGWNTRQDPGSVPFYDYTTVGIRCGDNGVLGIDVDIEDDELGAALEFALDLRGLKRLGRPLRRLLLVRVANGAPLSHDLTFEKDGRRESIQLLGKGKQFIGFGIHPDTGRPYEWPGRSPLDTPVGELLTVDQEALEQKLVEVAARYGWRQRIVARLSGLQQFESIPRDAQEREKLGKWGVGQVEDALAVLRTMLPGTGRGGFSRDLGLRVGTLVCSGMLDGEQIAHSIYEATGGDYNSAYHSFPRGCAMSVGKAAADMLESVRRGPALLAKAVAMGLPNGFPALPTPAEVAAATPGRFLSDTAKQSLKAALIDKAFRLGEQKPRGGRPNGEQREFASLLAGFAEAHALTGSEANEISAVAKVALPMSAPDEYATAARATVDALLAGNEPIDALAIGDKARRNIIKEERGGLIRVRNSREALMFDGTDAGAAAYAAAQLCGGNPANDIVYEHGRFWIRDGHTWRAAEPEEDIAAVNSTRALSYETKDGAKKFNLSNQRYEAVHRTMRRDGAKKGFFAPVDGLALRDCFVAVDNSTGPHFVPYEDANVNVRHCLPITSADITAAEFKGSKFQQFMTGALSETALKALQELLGVGMLGRMPKMSSPVALYLIGAASSGKSTLIKIVENAFPRDLVAEFDPTRLDETHYSCAHVGKRFLVNSDMSTTKGVCVEEFKRYVTGETVRANEKYMPAFNFKPEGLIMLAANDRPHFRGSRLDDGIQRRLAIFEFKRVVAPSQCIAELHEIIADTELAVVVAWALTGAARVAANGNRWSIDVQAFITAGANDWAEELDATEAFVADRVEADAAFALSSSESYAAFTAYWREQGFQGSPASAKSFGRRLRNALRKRGVHFSESPDTAHRGLRGVRLKGASTPTIRQVWPLTG